MIFLVCQFKCEILVSDCVNHPFMINHKICMYRYWYRLYNSVSYEIM